MKKPTKQQIKAIKAKYRTVKGIDRFDFMVKNLKEHGLLNERMNATDIAFAHKKNFGGIGKLDGWVNPHYTGHFNKHGVPDPELEIKNAKKRDPTRFGQGNYGKVVPKGDRRSGRQEYNSSKQRYENFAGSSR